MKKITTITRFSLVFCFLQIFVSFPLRADYIRRISSREGIANNSILSICQDKQGYIYLGTCNGLDIWDGFKMQHIPVANNGNNGTSGNIIENLIRIDDEYTWVNTNYGLDLMKGKSIVRNYDQFYGVIYMACSGLEHSYVFTISRELHRYNSQINDFEKIAELDSFHYKNFLCALCNDSGKIYFVESDGIFCFDYDAAQKELRQASRILDMKIAFATNEGDSAFIISEDGYLYKFDALSGSLVFLYNLAEQIKQYGTVSDIISDGDDIWVSFLYGGLIRLNFSPERVPGYDVTSIPVDCGVFCLMRDSGQDIIWIATDGQGLLMYARSPVSFSNYLHSDLFSDDSTPVRALLLDSDNTLWMGTKGGGVTRVMNFSTNSSISVKDVVHYSVENGLSSPIIYAFEESERGIMWVGTEGNGLDWWSPEDDSFHNLKGNVPPDLKWVHSIYERSRDTIWVASVGCGIYKLVLKDSVVPEVKLWEKMEFSFDTINNEFYFSMYADRQGVMCFGNRGGGLVLYNSRDNSSEIISLSKGRNNLANDIWSITRCNDNLWIGTGYGLLRLDSDLKVHDTPVKVAVHSILPSSDDKLWIATNSGLIQYCTHTEKMTKYDYSAGLKTLEFCDGAAFTADSSTMFFGGTNGFVAIDYISGNCIQDSGHREFVPEIIFDYVKINNEKESISNWDEDKLLVIPPRKKLTSIGINTIDYLNRADYAYEYRFDNSESGWVTCSEEINFTNPDYGRHTLEIRYKNLSSAYVSKPRTLSILVKAPFYASVFAIILYVTACLLLFFTIGLAIYRKRQMRRHAQIERITSQFKEELTESRLQIFQNFTRELISPVTTISTLAQCIGNSDSGYNDIKEQSQNLVRQTARMNSILTMFNQFRESNDVQMPVSRKVFSINELIDTTIAIYKNTAEKKFISFDSDIQSGLVCCSDTEKIAVIIDTFIRNAVAHSLSNSVVKVKAGTDSRGKINISVSNEGDWISRNDIDYISDKYKVLEHLSSGGLTGERLQERLKLAICYNLATMTGVNIGFAGEDGIVTFSLVIDKNMQTADTDADASLEKNSMEQSHDSVLFYDELLDNEQLNRFDLDDDKELFYILGNDVSLINVVANVFSKDYNTRMFMDIEKFNKAMRQKLPDIVICENVASSNQISRAITSIKNDRTTGHIPVIILSAMDAATENLAESEADVCVRVPFNVKYLKTVALQNINRMENLRDYFSSSFSVYAFSDGKILQKEDREMLEKLYQIIKENISDSHITTADIARKMAMSQRKLYQKLESTINITPSNILKEYRLLYAERLLVTSSLSIDEIMCKSGFGNRGTFYKNFAQRYGCTPGEYRNSKQCPVL